MKCITKLVLLQVHFVEGADVGILYLCFLQNRSIVL